MIETKQFSIAVIGDWHLAFVTAACLADAGHKTALVNPFRKWSGFPPPPVHEPGLQEMMNMARAAGRLECLNSIDDGWSAEMVWMAVDTPVTDNDEPQVAPLIEIAKMVAKQKSQPLTFATSSQIPLGFHKQLEAILGKKIAYIPENLRLGQGIATFRKADRTVIGASSSDVAERVKTALASFETQFMLCDLATAEMVKHANNAFLATSISFANEMANIGSRFGVDNYFVAQALKLDSRIGPKAYLSPGLGFAGGTLPRDLRVLEALGKSHDIPTRLVSSVLDVNRSTCQMVAELTARSLAANNRKVLILGYTYKAETDTLRRSLSIDIAEALQKHGVECHGFDPFMNGKDISALKNLIRHHDRLEDVPACSVALLMTARPGFKELDWSKFKRDGSVLMIDTLGFLNSPALESAGIRHRMLWAPSH